MATRDLRQSDLALDVPEHNIRENARRRAHLLVEAGLNFPAARGPPIPELASNFIKALDAAGSSCCLQSGAGGPESHVEEHLASAV